MRRRESHSLPALAACIWLLPLLEGLQTAVWWTVRCHTYAGMSVLCRCWSSQICRLTLASPATYAARTPEGRGVAYNCSCFKTYPPHPARLRFCLSQVARVQHEAEMDEVCGVRCGAGVWPGLLLRVGGAEEYVSREEGGVTSARSLVQVINAVFSALPRDELLGQCRPSNAMPCHAIHPCDPSAHQQQPLIRLNRLLHGAPMLISSCHLPVVRACVRPWQRGCGRRRWRMAP
jgi:hypothetical protein